MNVAVREKPQMTVHGLCGALEEFIRDNNGSRDVTLRWFAAYLEETLGIARRVRADNLDEPEKRNVNAHRLSEIAKAKADKQQEIDRLDSEARKLGASA